MVLRFCRRRPELVVILAGVSASLHIGKVSPALPVLRDVLGVTLLQAGFLLSMVQLAGMLLGLVVGLTADGVGLRRSILGGLLLLSGSSVLGGLATDAPTLLALRAFEGLGILLATMPAPGLIRRLVPPARMSGMLGLWGAYMPFGTACALLLGPWVLQAGGWPAWWWGLAVFSSVLAWAVWRSVPVDPSRVPADADRGGLRDSTRPPGWPARLRLTLAASGPWLVALSFAMYAGQWLSVIGFLPSMVAQHAVSGAWASAPLALVALVNMVGNIASGRLLQRGVPAHRLLYAGFCAMGIGALLAFVVLPGGTPLPAGLRYAGVVVFSMVGGLIPGTLFSLAVAVAPSESSVSTTVGWMQQCSSVGQFVGPPIVAWVAAQAGGWQLTWVVTGSCCVVGVALAGQLARRGKGS